MQYRKTAGMSVSPVRDQEYDEGMEMRNPMFSTVGTGKPSPGFLESMRKARESKDWQDTRVSTSHPGLAARGSFGIRTKLAVLAFLLVGIGLFISGGVIYWSGDYGEDEMKTGMDLLLCSSIPLVPGIYGAVRWVGNSNGWDGYQTIGFSYD
jgi:hypothetical protein